MKFKDKIKYLKYKANFVVVFIALILLILSYCFYLCLDFNDLLSSPNLCIYLFYFVELGVILFCLRGVLLVLFSTKLKLVDGYIFKKNKHYNHAGSDYIFDYKARAMSNNKQYTTPWFSYRKRYMNYDNVPVKIIVKNNKGIDYYIDNYSFKNN